MKTNGNISRKKQTGFSMIEVLVAATILMVIVLLLSMLFQQTSLAWRTGVRRANSFMQVRTLIGAIQRDASAAVDAREVPDALKNGDQSFSGSLKFYTLTGVGFKNGATPFRTLSYITYNTSGTRTESILKSDGSWDSPSSTQIKDFLNKTGSKNAVSTTLNSPNAVYEDTAGLPLFVTFTADVTLKGNSYDIGAASAGPDKTWNTKDDIRTWVEE